MLDVCMNMNLCHFSAPVSRSCLLPRGPVVSGEPSRTGRSDLLYQSRRSGPHQRRRTPRNKTACCCRQDGRSPLNLVCPDLRYKASIRRQEASVPSSFCLSLCISSWFTDAFLFFGELFLRGQLLLLLINLDHPHGDEGNSQMRANIGRLGWMYYCRCVVDVCRGGQQDAWVQRSWYFTGYLWSIRGRSK